jgi:hypothetical protein
MKPNANPFYKKDGPMIIIAGAGLKNKSIDH